MSILLLEWTYKNKSQKPINENGHIFQLTASEIKNILMAKRTDSEPNLLIEYTDQQTIVEITHCLNKVKYNTAYNLETNTDTDQGSSKWIVIHYNDNSRKKTFVHVYDSAYIIDNVVYYIDTTSVSNLDTYFPS